MEKGWMERAGWGNILRGLTSGISVGTGSHMHPRPPRLAEGWILSARRAPHPSSSPSSTSA